MEEFEEGSMQNRQNYSAMDLLSRLGCKGKNFPGKFEVKEENDFEAELTLGLSLNGKFGVDPHRGMMSGSSFVVPELMKPVKFEEEPVESVGGYLPKEVVRKRKEDQSVRRMEAKRRRMEKIRSFRPVQDCDKVLPEAMIKRTEKRSPSTSKTPTGLQEQSDIESETNKPVTCNENQLPRLTTAKGEGPDTPMSLPEQQLSDLESEPNNSVTITSYANRSTVVSKEMVRHMLLKMTCVTTKGEGTNGNEIRGLLYPCKKGEEVKIVCICHGSFLSPAEFVKHAGGGDVANPLRHIVISSSPIS